jgi:Flp pilus assembly pilin Flp
MVQHLAFHFNSVRSRVSQRGQGMTEYIIIVALVAVAAIAVYQYFGQVLRSQTAAMAKEIAGEDGTQQARAAQTAAESAAGQVGAKSLKSFTGNNDSGPR